GDGLVAILIGIKAVFAGLVHVECKILSVDLKGVVAAKVAYAEENRPERETKLRNIVADVEKGQAGLRTETDGCAADLDFGAGIFIHPQIVADGHATIPYSIEPIALAAWLKRNRACCVADAPRASRRILIGLAVIGLITGRRRFWRATLVLRQCRRNHLEKQENRRRKHCQGKCCAFFHTVPLYGHSSEPL